MNYNTTSQVWSYSPLKYWPNADDDKVTFFAYAPYQTYASASSIGNGVNATYTTNTSAGLPQIQFFVNPVASAMIDFVAGQNMDMVRQQEKVTFNLKHQLTRATFSAMAYVDNVEEYGADADGDGASYIVVKSMDIVDGDYNQFYTEGIYTFDNVTTDDDKTVHTQDGIWSGLANPTAYSFASIMGYNNVVDSEGNETDLLKADYKEAGVVLPIAQTTYSSLFASGEYLFLLPPNGAAGLDGSIEIEIVYDIVTIDSKLAAGYSSTESTYTISLPEGTLAQGKAYDFQLLFNVTEILVEPNIVDWDDEDEETFTDDIDPFEGDAIINPITEIGLELDGTTIYVGQTIEIEASPTYETDLSNSNDALSWSAYPEEYVSLAVDSSNDAILAVTGAKVGESVITVKSLSGVEKSVTITVISSDFNFSTPEGGILEVGKDFTPQPGDGDDLTGITITWTSSNESVVIVDSETGEITAIAPGVAVITGTDQLGTIVHQYTVTVPGGDGEYEQIEIDGFGYIELYGSAIYAQGYNSVSGTISLTGVCTETPATAVNLTISGSDGITVSPTDPINKSSSFSAEVDFTATKAGTITIKNGGTTIKEIPVNFVETPISYLGSATIGGATLGAVTSISVDDVNSANITGMINTSDGSIAENETYVNREFKGSVVSAVGGTIKVYCMQANNFELYDETAEAEANALEAIIFQSTGNIYSINGTIVEDVVGNDTPSYTYSQKGAATLTTSGDATFSNFNGATGFAVGSAFTFSANDIGTNQSVLS